MMHDEVTAYCTTCKHGLVTEEVLPDAEPAGLLLGFTETHTRTHPDHVVEMRRETAAEIQTRQTREAAAEAERAVESRALAERQRQIIRQRLSTGPGRR